MATSKSSPTAGETADATSDAPAADGQTIITEPTSETTAVDAPVAEDAPSLSEPAPEKTSEPDTFGVVDPDLGRPRIVDMTGIRYTGFADERHLSKADLATLGANHDEDLVWYGKGFVVPKAGLSAQTIDALNSLDEFTAI
jgi:hypothetical protein